MLRPEFISVLQEKIEGSTKKQCDEFLNAFTEAVAETLAVGNEVKIAGFGTFKVRKINAHKGVNPQTKEAIDIPDSYVPMFKVGKPLKDAVAERK